MIFEELLYSQAARVELDSAGRIRIPQRLLEQLGIQQSAVILGVKDHLEVREPADWAERRNRMLLADQSMIMMRARQARMERLARSRRQET